MTQKNPVEFLRLMNETNDAIAAREAEELAQKHVGMDPIRVQREAERRERLGQLRARQHVSGRRNSPVRNVFGYTDLR